MNCPYCFDKNTVVVDSRESEDGGAVRRRRKCEVCDRRFTTYERVEGLDLKVVKKDGTKEDFDREKIKRGLIKATWKRPVTLKQIDDLIMDVERKLRSSQANEIKSWQIGNLVINRLKKIDKLGYLLFATVYRDFDDIDDFKKEIEKIDTLTEEDDSDI
ncbi:MAG TPA: transcriptional regulator NrdR [Candidatus Woesebacteria bacterium]|nr:transcriptional regulator NrdR [Candidatus Woesebacteria bacterium]